MSTQPVAFPRAATGIKAEEHTVAVSVLVPVLDKAESVLALAAQVAGVLDRLGKSFEMRHALANPNPSAGSGAEIARSPSSSSFGTL